MTFDRRRFHEISETEGDSPRSRKFREIRLRSKVVSYKYPGRCEISETILAFLNEFRMFVKFWNFDQTELLVIWKKLGSDALTFTGRLKSESGDIDSLSEGKYSRMGENTAMKRFELLLPAMPEVEGIKIKTLDQFRRLDKVAFNLVVRYFTTNVRKANCSSFVE